ARERAPLDWTPPGARRGDGCRPDRARADQVVSRPRHRHARGLGADGELRARDGDAGRPHQARHRRDRAPRDRGPDRAGRRDPAPGPACLPRLLRQAGQDGGDGCRRMAAHRRRRPARRRGLPHDHRPDEGSHHHGGRQERHAVRDREPAEVLALHRGCGRDRRPAEVPLLPRDDRSRDRRAVRPGRGPAVHELRVAVSRGGGAGADLGRDRAGEPRAGPRRDHQEVPPHRADLDAGGRGADADDEAQAGLREQEVRRADRGHVPRGLAMRSTLRKELDMRRLVAMALLAGVLAVASWVGADTRGVSKGEIILGMHTDLSGPAATYGVSSSNAVKMRFDDLNGAGGIHGRKIKLFVEDTQYQVPRAVQAGNKLINRDNIFAMVAGLGTPMNNALFKEQFDAGVPNLFPLSAARSMFEPFNRLKFYGAATYVDQVRAGINYFVTKKGKKALCAMYQDTDFGKEVL